MPVSKSDQSTAKICKFCDESAHCRVWNIKFDQDILHTIKKKFPSWFSPLKIKAISSLLKPGIEIMSEAPSSSGNTFASSMEHSEQKRVSPPKAIVDSSPLQTAMDRNRESLKVKLLVRRSANQLVEQGILPPLKTSPAIHEQRKLLERAKTGDLLKAKIQQRPARQELERRHILESHEGHIDPSLADKYRMLEKAILVDQLNKKILHRPGPLELIEKNILHANEPIERIVKEGLVPFKVSSEENLTDKNFLSFEDDSQSSESDLFQQSQVHVDANKPTIPEFDVKPKEVALIPQDHHVFESMPSTSGVINISLVPTSNMLSSTSSPISIATFKIHNPMVETINIPPPPPPPKLELITCHVRPMIQTQVKGLVNTSNYLPIQIAENPMTVNTILSTSLVQSQTQNTVNQHVSSFIQNNQKFSAPGKDKNRKKCKNKAASKARAIKFHEYKGPPNKGSSSTSTLTSANLAANKKLGETNYELIMQQQCLLEYLEGIYKNPNGSIGKLEPENQKFSTKSIKIEKASECANDDTTTNEKMKTFNKPHVTIFPSKPSTQASPSNSDTTKDSSITDVAKLSKMKVSELKAYLKRVNLPVSGPKPLLIERLKPYLPLKPLDDNKDEASSMMSEGNDFYNSSLNSVSSAESDLDNMDSQQCLSVGSSTKDEDIVAEQQRKIEELQRKLQQSQHELEQMKQIKTVDPPAQAMDEHQLVFDAPYQMQSQLPTVFVVDVPQASTSISENLNSNISPIEPQIISEVSSSSGMHEIPAKSPGLEQMLNQERDSELSLSQQIEKEVSVCTSTSNIIPMSQDITDVLEILLKNGEWPEISDDGKGINSDFLQRITGNSSNSNESILAAKSFIEEVLAQNSFDVVSPMNEDTILHSEESIEKILDTVTPSSVNYSNGFTSNHIEFPMDIEDDTPLPLDNGDFNRNMFQTPDFMGKTHQNNSHPSFEQNHFNHCDNQFLKTAKNSSENCPAIKSEFPEGLQKSQSNCTKNGLIGNFDHNLFDTLKNNNINNNNNNTCNELFLMPDEVKFAKDDNKSLINNLHLTNNYDLFTSGLDNTAMDFESIIPYNDLQAHDSLFQISSYDNAMNRGGGFGSFNDHNNSLLFNDDTRMSNGEMTCEVDNLLCNL